MNLYNDPNRAFSDGKEYGQHSISHYANMLGVRCEVPNTIVVLTIASPSTHLTSL